MASADVLDLAKLLAPISEASPTGSDPRADASPLSEFLKIKEERKAARQVETRIDKGDEEQLPPDWRPLVQRAEKLLATQSKDLEVVAYLIEGLTRTRGFAGIRDGFRLAADLIETFWDQLYPSPGDADIENRFSHLLQLNGIESTGALIVPIAKIPFTPPGDEGPFSLTHYQSALATSRIADPKARQKRIEEGALTLETIQKAVAATPASHFRDLVDDIGQCISEFRRFGSTLNGKSGYDPPSDSLISALDGYLTVVKDLARAKLDAGPAPAPTPSKPDGGAGTPAAPPPPPPGTIQNREDALQALIKVAEFFRKTEPQSVIPFALEQVVAWGRMSLPELLAELIPDDGPRKNLFRQVGIKPPDGKK